MRIKQWIIVVASAMLMPLMGNAACSYVGSVVPDGRITGYNYNVSTGTDAALFTRVVAGHSYSLEAFGQFSLFGSNGFTAFFDQGGCATANGAGFVDTTNVLPSPTQASIDQNFARASYISPSNQYIRVTLHAITGSSGVMVVVTDTTMFSPSFYTGGGYVTGYTFANNTNSPINGVLTLTNSAGTVVGSSNIALPANGSALVYTDGSQHINASQMTISGTVAGSATFAHTGPPNSVIAAAYLQNFSGPTPFTQPYDFKPMFQHQ